MFSDWAPSAAIRRMRWGYSPPGGSGEFCNLVPLQAEPVPGGATGATHCPPLVIRPPGPVITTQPRRAASRSVTARSSSSVCRWKRGPGVDRLDLNAVRSSKDSRSAAAAGRRSPHPRPTGCLAFWYFRDFGVGSEARPRHVDTIRRRRLRRRSLIGVLAVAAQRVPQYTLPLDRHPAAPSIARAAQRATRNRATVSRG